MLSELAITVLEALSSSVEQILITRASSHLIGCHSSIQTFDVL